MMLKTNYENLFLNCVGHKPVYEPHKICRNFKIFTTDWDKIPSTSKIGNKGGDETADADQADWSALSWLLNVQPKQQVPSIIAGLAKTKW